MPNKLNVAMVTQIEDSKWFTNHDQQRYDNLWVVEMQSGEKVALYVGFRTTGPLEDNTRIPNGDDALGKLAKIHEQLGSPASGPFLAWSQIESEEIVYMCMWDLSTKYPFTKQKFTVKELKCCDQREYHQR